MAQLSDNVVLASDIGSKYFRNAMITGLILAFGLLVCMDGGKADGLYRSIIRFPAQSIICIVIGPLIGHLVGGWAGTRIFLRNWNPWVVSLALGFGCVWATTLLFSLVGFCTEGLHGPFKDQAVQDYILKPLLSVTVFGCLFIVLVATGMAYLFHIRRIKDFGVDVREVQR